MNYLEISSFIDAKRKSKAFLEQELDNIRSKTEQMKAAPPVLWYTNGYYIFKRTLLLTLVVVFAVMLISTFIRQDMYVKLFHTKFDGPISLIINDNFATKRSTKFSESSATEMKSSETIYFQNVRADIQDKIISDLFSYTLWTVRVLLFIGIVLFWYLARLTRQLYRKNRQVSAYYKSNLHLMDVYREMIEEQQYEIEFLTGAARKIR